jgi:hypothetical protein
MKTLLDYISDVERTGSTNKGEYSGPCPFCGGQDRFIVWPNHPDYDSGCTWCRQCRWWGDGIKYLREVEDFDFQEACKALSVEHKLNGSDVNDRSRFGTPPKQRGTAKPPSTSDDSKTVLAPPPEQWRASAERLCTVAKQTLWADTKVALRAREYLMDRGLTEDTIWRFDLGLHPGERRVPRKNWGLNEPGTLWLPPGIVIPWVVDGTYWRVSIRRPDGHVHAPEGPDRKYHSIKGSSGKVLYNADAISTSAPVVLVEGVFDAIIVDQEAGDGRAVACATGSTTGARAAKWRTLLSIAPGVLVAFDSESAGEKAARHWIDALPNARRWRPHDHDINDLLRRSGNVKNWVRRGSALVSSNETDGQGPSGNDQETPSENSCEESLPEPEWVPGPLPATIPLSDGGSIEIFKRTMRDEYLGVAFRLPYNEEFVADLKNIVREWAREWRPDEKIWIVDAEWFQQVLGMAEYHYGFRWRRKKFSQVPNEVVTATQT